MCSTLIIYKVKNLMETVMKTDNYPFFFLETISYILIYHHATLMMSSFVIFPKKPSQKIKSFSIMNLST